MYGKGILGGRILCSLGGNAEAWGFATVSSWVSIQQLKFEQNRLIDVVNCSLTYGKFPEKFKTSLVTPVPKIQETIKSSTISTNKRGAHI